MPDGASGHSKMDNTLVKTLARAFRCKWWLEFDEFTTIADLAKHEGIAPSYMTPVLRLMWLGISFKGNRSRCKRWRRCRSRFRQNGQNSKITSADAQGPKPPFEASLHYCSSIKQSGHLP